MTRLSDSQGRQDAPLTIWEALKLAEDRHAYGTVAVAGRPEVKLHVFGGRLLTLDDAGNSLDLVQAIASVLTGRDHCWLVPLCDVADAQTRPSVSIAESLVASVRLAAVSATLAFDADHVRDDIVALTVNLIADPQPAVVAGSATDDETASRKAEADRLRAEFFERRSHRRGPRPGAAKPARTTSRPQTIQRPGPSPAAESRSRAAAIAGLQLDPVAPAPPKDLEPRDRVEAAPRPTQRTALRSLIRSLMS